MSITRTIAKRSLWARPGRTLFAVLGIAVGIATVVAIFTLDHNTILGLSSPNDADWKADIQVSPSTRLADPKRNLHDIPGIRNVSPFFQNSAGVRPASATDPDDPRHRKVYVRLFAYDATQSDVFQPYRVERGRDLRDLENEILIGAGLAEELEVGPGDGLLVSRPRRAAKRLCVDGEFKVVRPEEALAPREEVFTIAGVIAREKLGFRSRGRVVVLHHPSAAVLYEGTHIAKSFVVKKDPDADIERIEASLAETFSYDLGKSILVGQAADERAFRNGVRLAGLLAMVLGLFVIFHTLSIALIERMKEIATLNALGATRPQIARVFVTEAALLALLGGGLGLGGGLALAKGMLSMGITTLGLGKYVRVFEVPWDVVLPLTLAGCGIALLGSVYPLLRMRSTNMAVVLRGDEATGNASAQRGFRLFSFILLALVMPAAWFAFVPVVGETRGAVMGVLLVGVGLLVLLIALPLLVPGLLAAVAARLARPFTGWWPLAGQLAARSIQERPVRIAVATVGIAMVTAAFISLEGMTNSLRGEMEVWAEQAVNDKVFIYNIPEHGFDELAEVLHRVPDVLGVERGDARTYVPFLLTSMSTDEISGYGPCAEDARVLDSMKHEHGIIVSDRLARELGYEPGEIVHINTPAGDVKEFTVAAVTDAYGYFPFPDERIYGIIGDHWMKKYFCIDMEKTSRVAVRLRDGSDVDAARAKIREVCDTHFPTAGDWKIETGLRVRDLGVADITRDFVLFDIIIGLTALLAMLGVLNGQLLSALERTKELGILKALGTTGRQIAGFVMLESAVIGITGGILGTALGAALTPVVVEALISISALPLPHRGAGWAYPVAILGAGALTVLAGLYPIWRINRMKPVVAIRTGG